MTTPAPIAALPLAELDLLTVNERTLLAKLCEGLTFRQIDDALSLEAGSAHRLRKHLFRKIGVRTRHEACASVYPTHDIRQADLRRLLDVHYSLSRREADVLVLMFCQPSLSRKQMSMQLGISDNTTRFMMNRINKKLGVSSRAEAIYTVHALLQQEKGIATMQINETHTQEQEPAIQEAITELVTKWGYRDISALIAAWKKHVAEQYPEESTDTTAYLCILQTPEGGPVYCRSAKRLFRELETARTRNEPYEQCPAPDPAQHMWMVVGNFDIDEDA